MKQTGADPIRHRTFARVGLFGNPSDQYGGRTIAFSISNFYAEVVLTPSADASSSAVRILPHPVYDSTCYKSLDDLLERTSSEGLYGGVRLLTAACKRFVAYCGEYGIDLKARCCKDGRRDADADGKSSDESSRDGGGSQEHVDHLHGRGFTLSYDTTVPRQTGMAGSSAIILSALRCLMEWYGIGEDLLPAAALPGLVLSVEAQELGIAAGLQDRVIQVYGGVVHMDFDPSYMEAHGGVGRYSRLSPKLLPWPLYVMYSQNPSESGKVHSGVKAKWLAGDLQVRALMNRVALCGDEGLRLLLSGSAGSGSGTGYESQSSLESGLASKQQQQQHHEHGESGGGGAVAASESTPNGDRGRDRRLAALMTENFDLRRALFGDEVLGARNLRMVELARSVGAGVNFTGSGGAVVVFCPEGTAQAEALRTAAEAEGFTLACLQVGPETAYLPPLPQS